VRLLELFAGAGGAHLGLRAAGFEAVACVERDSDACATLRAGGCDVVIEADVRTVDLTPWAGVDALWASFPCQCWSTAGARKGGRDEDRNGWPWTVRAVDEVGPAWLIWENVPGLAQHSSAAHKERYPDPLDCPGCYLEHVILPDMRERFAHVAIFRLNAADFGVPQHRRRLFGIAGPVPVVPPRATHGPGMFRRPWVAARVAFDGPCPVAMKWNDARLDGGRNSTQNPTQERSRGLGEPSQTVGGCDSLILRGPGGKRCVTLKECARLQGMHDHPWHGDRKSCHRQIGNAVPPKLAEVVGRAVLQAARGET